MANANKKLKQNEQRIEEEAQKELALQAEKRKKENRKTYIGLVLRALLYAVIYTCLTLLLGKINIGGFNFSYGMFQCRLTEAMMGLVFFDPAAAPGIILGCFVSDCLGPGGLYDAMVGTVASFFGYYFIKFVAERGMKPWAGLLMHALMNAIMLGVMFGYTEAYGSYGMLVAFGAVFIGELISAVGGGMLVYKIGSRSWEDILSETEKSKEPQPDPSEML